MKKLFTILTAVLLTASVFAQVPEKMSYQAVIRNSSDVLVSNATIGMQISILQGSAIGTVVYIETQTPTTNINGLLSIEIGGEIGFDTITWANGPYFLETNIDIEGGSIYTITGVSQLLTVPYALHAKTAETITGTINETDPVYTGSQAYNITATDITNLSNLSDVNTGDQDISGIATNQQAIQDTASQIRTDIPDVSGFLTAETDPSVPIATQAGQMQYWNGSVWVTVSVGNEGYVLTFVGGVPTWLPLLEDGEIYNPITDKIWMDRNLGATQVATSSTDAASYGDLYQWGRGADGHQIRTSGTSTTLSSLDAPGHGNFIKSPSSPYDWRSPQNPNLWQGVSGVNNPCPDGYRLPTDTEWEAERASWSSQNSAGAYASPLKLSVCGYRDFGNSALYHVDLNGSYWSSTTGGGSLILNIKSSEAPIVSTGRAIGGSVRCIKD